jgi:hypothetical protein
MHHPFNRTQPGDLVAAPMLTETMILINSYPIADALFNKRGSLYSDRPVLTMSGELVGWANTMGFLSMGDQLKYSREIFHKHIGTAALMKRWNPLVQEKLRNCMLRILRNPDSEALAGHLRQYVPVSFWGARMLISAAA